MFEKTKYKIGIWKARRNEKKNKHQFIDSGNFWNGIQTVLISIPKSSELLTEVFSFADQLQKEHKFQYEIWYTGDQLHHVQDHFSKSNVITPDQLQYQRWQIPEKKSVHNKFNPKIDLIIDLNMDFQLDGVYIWTCFPTAYRVGMFSFEEDQFFDLVMKFNENTSYPERLSKLAGILKQLN